MDPDNDQVVDVERVAQAERVAADRERPVVQLLAEALEHEVLEEPDLRHGEVLVELAEPGLLERMTAVARRQRLDAIEECAATFSYISAASAKSSST